VTAIDTIGQIASIVGSIAGLMTPGIALEQGVIQAWNALKPLLSSQVIPPDPTPEQLADLDATIHAQAIAAHAAWHRGDAPAPVSQPDGHAD
jgi:hypothetical protein